jgi:hypothetical protein
LGSFVDRKKLFRIRSKIPTSKSFDSETGLILDNTGSRQALRYRTIHRTFFHCKIKERLQRDLLQYAIVMYGTNNILYANVDPAPGPELKPWTLILFRPVCV